MTPGSHVRTELGAYVLGALTPNERRHVERHLEACRGCREELDGLSQLPALLGGLSAEEVTADEVARGPAPRPAAAPPPAGTPPAAPPQTAPPRTAAPTHTDTERRLRRQLRRWRAAASAAAGAAVVATVVAAAPWQAPPDRLVVPVVPLAETASTVEGTVAAYAWEWGTTVEIRVEDLPVADAYAVWAISDSGRRDRAGTWGPTGGRSAHVRGASAIHRDDLARVEITDPRGTPLFAATFGAAGTDRPPAAQPVSRAANASSPFR